MGDLKRLPRGGVLLVNTLLLSLCTNHCRGRGPLPRGGSCEIFEFVIGRGKGKEEEKPLAFLASTVAVVEMRLFLMPDRCCHYCDHRKICAVGSPKDSPSLID